MITFHEPSDAYLYIRINDIVSSKEKRKEIVDVLRALGSVMEITPKVVYRALVMEKSTEG